MHSRSISASIACVTILLFQIGFPAYGQIQPATDGPQARRPEASGQSFQLPPGFRMELVAAEPLIVEPSGVCWDAEGRFYVSELHGYNLEGQYDIDALNRTGQLDRVVRRIQANDQAKKDAEAGTFGVIKQLQDTDGDGRMDQSVVFAKGLPPCFGMVPAREGILVICAPDIYYLADLDDDGIADVRERLFAGFQEGVLERRINAPQWGLDNWVYVGGGGRADKISGPYLDQPVSLGRTDFRFKSDGSVIEPITGSTDTFGHTFTAEGDRLTIGTGTPGYQVLPFPWTYLKRNPELAVPSLERNAADYQFTFPAAPPHPWRSRRASDPGFSKYYTERYGKAESTPNGYFTSACSPFIYRDIALPEAYRGHNFSCEPAQNLVHHSVPSWEGPVLRLKKGDEAKKEFLASTDPWFHPMNLTHGPEGAIYITDFYREIIEDYSAIPRYLQQQYGLTNGMHHGRIWRLTHVDAPQAPPANMSHLADYQLAAEVGSPHAWRRETARRLLIEGGAVEMEGRLMRHVERQDTRPEAAINALYTLEGLQRISATCIEQALAHPHWSVKRHALRLADQLPPKSPAAMAAADWLSDVLNYGNEERLLLQIALSLGSYPTEGAVNALAYLANQHGKIPWMDIAIASSANDREAAILSRHLIENREGSDLSERLVAMVASRGDTTQVQQTKSIVQFIAKSPAKELYARILEAASTSSAQALERIALDPPSKPDPATLKRIETKWPDYLAALNRSDHKANGPALFKEHCASCHQAKGMGSQAGPNLDAEFQRASETILRDILFPHESITEGFETVQLVMRQGADVMGWMGSESPSSITLKFPGDQTFTFLRKRIERVRTHDVSMMPAQFSEILSPGEAATLVRFLRSTSTQP